MGRERKGNRDPLGDELQWFFSDGDLSTASSFGGFVQMAMTGIQQGGRTNGVERRAVAIADRSDVTRHRAIRRRLRALTEPKHVDVLYAAYGPHDWPHVIDAAFGRGMGERFTRAFGAEHIGPALLTEKLAEMHRKATGQEAVAEAPTMEALDGVHVELCDDFRKRIAKKIQAKMAALRGKRPSTALSRSVVEIAEARGISLDELAAAHGMRRGLRPTRRMVATGAKPVEKPVPTPGALLAAMVSAAFQEKPAKGGKRRQAADVALARVREIASEAVIMLTKARMAVPEEEWTPPHRDRPAKRLRAAVARHDSGVRAPRRPVIAFDFEEVVRPDGPSNAAAARYA